MKKTAQAAYIAAAARRRAKVLKLYHRGVHVLDIAEKVGLTRQRVYQIIGPQR